MRRQNTTLEDMVKLLEACGFINADSDRQKQDQLQMFIQFQASRTDTRYTEIFADANLDKLNTATGTDLTVEDLHKFQGYCQRQQTYLRMGSGEVQHLDAEKIKTYKEITDQVLDKIQKLETAHIDLNGAKKELKSAEKELKSVTKLCTKKEGEEAKLIEKLQSLEAKSENVTGKKLQLIQKEIKHLKEVRIPALQTKVKDCQAKVKVAEERVKKAKNDVDIASDQAKKDLHDKIYSPKEKSDLAAREAQRPSKRF